MARAEIPGGRLGRVGSAGEQEPPSIGSTTAGHEGGVSASVRRFSDPLRRGRRQLRVVPDVERTNLRLCNLNCGICSCESTWGDHIDENGSWAVTASALTLELTGKATDFAYCVEGNTLNVSAIDVRMTFERVYLSSNPMACAGRGPAECTAGSGCTSGVCVGGPECLATSEGSCLTNPGCSWDSAACTGEAQAGCALGDYGVVPGCELLDNPPG
jgi:hypothetical protein